ncbi:fatty acid desaturase [Trichothermofontia sp.]
MVQSGQNLTVNDGTCGERWLGLGIAVGLLAAWLLSFRILADYPPHLWSGLGLGGAIVLRTLLQTGLFIIAHDAMHQSLLPQHLRLNHALGAIALFCYAGLDYPYCRHHHFRHHQNPGQTQDQDCRGQDRGPLIWYYQFLANYLDHWQMLRCCLVVLSLLGFTYHRNSGFQDSCWTVLCFYLLPLFLSSLQLFIFGTYLPHRRLEDEPSNAHCSRSLAYPLWLSFLACYHFGYHWEHHEYPHLPWYQLPQAHRQLFH